MGEDKGREEVEREGTSFGLVSVSLSLNLHYLE
jgi:hypothetical protein